MDLMVDIKKIVSLSSILLFTCAPFVQLFPDSSSAEDAVETHEYRRVQRIEVQAENLPAGTAFDPKPVLEKMKTKVGEPFSQQIFDIDLKVLSDEYDRVEPSIDVQETTVLITLKVWLRPTIHSIVWQGNEHIKSSTLRKELGIKENQIFNRVTFNKKFNEVKEYYIKKGYFESQLSYTIKPIEGTQDIDIVIDVDEGRAGMIDDIVFNGFTDTEKSQILSMIHTKQYNLLTSWMTGQGIFNEEMIEQDRLTILGVLQNEGYGDARVDLQITNAEKEGRIVITLTAEHGLIFHFGKVTYSGNTLFSDEEIKRLFLIHDNDVYSPDKMRMTADAIKEFYGKKGYIDTHVQFETELSHDAPTYDVHFTIEEGAIYKIGLIKVIGNEQTQTHVILRESLLVPGETFNSAKLKATQERLQNTGYFKNVNVYPVRAQDDAILGDNYRDVYIEVEETTTGHASLFFGVSSGDGGFGGLDVTESNFNYKGIRKLPKQGFSALRGGGEYAHAKLQIGNKQRSYLLSWMDPYFRDSLWRVGFEGVLSESQLQAKDYEIDSIAGSVFASYPVSAYWTLGTKYRIKHADIDPHHHPSRDEKRTEKGTGNTSAVSMSMTYDSTDSIMKPHRGLRSKFETEFAGVGGDFSFLKYTYANSMYQQLWHHGIMKYRWEATFIQPIWWTQAPTKKGGASQIPVSERLFLGGENSVRGYRAFSLGPRFKSSDPVGGITDSVLSVEYLHEIFSIVDGFLFMDAGAVSTKRFAIDRYSMSYGGGLRIEIMNRVPITIGYGVPVNARHKSQVHKFFFTMGGQF
jgi:outer membrane protein insertion porin family